MAEIFTVTLNDDGTIAYRGKQPSDGILGVVAVLDLLAEAAHAGAITWQEVNSWDMTTERRLREIVARHQPSVDEHGGNSGYCRECELVWPCPTYRMGVDPTITNYCTWDPRDCVDEVEHGHEQWVLDGAGRA